MWNLGKSLPHCALSSCCCCSLRFSSVGMNFLLCTLGQEKDRHLEYSPIQRTKWRNLHWKCSWVIVQIPTYHAIGSTIEIFSRGPFPLQYPKLRNMWMNYYIFIFSVLGSKWPVKHRTPPAGPDHLMRPCTSPEETCFQAYCDCLQPWGSAPSLH